MAQLELTEDDQFADPVFARGQPGRQCPGDTASAQAALESWGC
jgi:hypothetical protein